MSYINNGLRGEGGTAHAGHGGYLKTFKPSAIGQLFDKGPLPPNPVAIPLPGKPTANVTKRKVHNRRVLRKIPTEIIDEYIAAVARSISGTPVGSGSTTINVGGSNPVVDTDNTLLRPQDSVSVNPLAAAAVRPTFNQGPPAPYNSDLGVSDTTPTPGSSSTSPGLVDISPTSSGSSSLEEINLSQLPEFTPRPGSRARQEDFVTAFRDRDNSTAEIANTVGHDATIDYPTQRNLVAGNPVSSVLDEGLLLTNGSVGTTTLAILPDPSTETITRSGQTLTEIIAQARESNVAEEVAVIGREMSQATADGVVENNMVGFVTDQLQQIAADRAAEQAALSLSVPSSSRSSTAEPSSSPITGSSSTTASPTTLSSDGSNNVARSGSIIGTNINLPTRGSSSIIGTRINLPRR